MALLAPWPLADPSSRAWPLALLVALPFVQPLAPGPVSNTVPLLLAWACAGGLLLAWMRVRPGHIAAGWALAAVIASLIGLVQFFGFAEALAPWVHVPAWLGDAVGNLRQRNQQATLLAMGLLALAWWQRQGASWRWLVPVLALVAVGLAATGSRTGLLQGVLFLLLVLWWGRGDWRDASARVRLLVLLGVPLLSYLLASWALPLGLERLHGMQVSTALARMSGAEGCGGRAVLWANVLHLIAQQPWTGWGWDELRYAHYITRYPGLRFCDILGHAHNLPLHLAFVWGVPAAIALSLGGLALLWRARPWRSAQGDAQLAWGVLAMIGLHSLLEFPLWYGPFQVAVLLSLWLMGAQVWLAARLPRLLPLAGGALLLGAALVAWDYLRVRQAYLPAPARMAWWRAEPMAAARSSWWFGRTAAFAEVTTTPVRVDNAPWLLEESLALLHHSPEPRVLTVLIRSAELSGETALADWHRQQFRHVYPQAFERSPWGPVR